MKILAINTLYPPSQIGGAERSLAVLAEGLAQAGHDVSVLCLAQGRSTTELRNGVTVHRLPAGNIYFAWDQRRHNAVSRFAWHLRDRGRASVQPAVERLIDSIRPDLLHANNLTGFGSGIIPAARRRGLPVVHTLRDFSLVCARAGLFRRGQDCENRCATCRFITAPRMAAAEGIDRVVGNSTYMIERHRREGLFRHIPARTIYNAVPALAAPREPPTQRSGAQVMRFGFVGMVKPEKGIEVLLAALEALPHRAWSLSIAGTGDAGYLAQLRSRFAGLPVAWLGFVPATQLYAAIDLLVIPSIWPEPMPRTLIEASAVPLPVIVSDAGGSAEVARLFPAAQVYPRNDRAALTAWLEQACDTGPRRIDPVPADIARMFSPARLVRDYALVFEEALIARGKVPLDARA